MLGQTRAPRSRAQRSLRISSAGVARWQHRRQHFQIADDRSQQIVEVMRDAAGQLADRLHLLGLAKLLFGCLPLGQIARDLGKADQLAGAVMDRIDDHIRPELGPVLAHPPSLGLVFARAPRGL